MGTLAYSSTIPLGRSGLQSEFYVYYSFLDSGTRAFLLVSICDFILKS